MSERNLTIITKIILFYSIFYVVMKLIIIFQGAWIVPNLLLALPFLIVAVISGIMVKQDKFSWFLVVIGAALIILARIYESRLVVWMHQSLS